MTAFCLGIFTCHAYAEGKPALTSIIAQAVSRDAYTQTELHRMQYHQVTQIEKLDKNGHVVHQQEVQSVIRPGAAQEIQVISVSGDQIPSDLDEAANQAKGQEQERRKHNFDLKTLVTRFNMFLFGEGEFLGQPAYILSFEPKPNQPYRDQTEKVLNQLHGRIWISKGNGTVLKTQATLAHPVSVAWIFARIEKLDFRYELRSTSSEFGPAWLQINVEVDAPLFSVHQRQVINLNHFEPRTQIAVGPTESSTPLSNAETKVAPGA